MVREGTAAHSAARSGVIISTSAAQATHQALSVEGRRRTVVTSYVSVRIVVRLDFKLPPVSILSLGTARPYSMPESPGILRGAGLKSL